MAETYPSFEELDASPEVDGPGVAIRLAAGDGARVQIGDPIVLHGAYGADTETLAQTNGEPLTGLLVVVIRRDQPSGRIHSVLDGHVMPAPDEETGSQEAGAGGDPGFVLYGYFNLDLVQFAKLPSEPGRYWVEATLGDAVSNRVGFEILER